MGIARLQVLAGHGKSSTRPGHAALRGGTSGDILEKSPRAATLSLTAGTFFYTTHKHGMCVLHPTLTRSARGTITPQSPKESGQTPHVCVSRCQRRACKKRQAQAGQKNVTTLCHLMTCTSSRQAPSSVTSFQLPPPGTKNTQPKGDTDAGCDCGSADRHLHAKSASRGITPSLWSDASQQSSDQHCRSAWRTAAPSAVLACHRVGERLTFDVSTCNLPPITSRHDSRRYLDIGFSHLL